MNYVEKLTSTAIYISAAFLAYRLLSWIFGFQPEEGTDSLSFVNKLTVVSIIVIFIGLAINKWVLKNHGKRNDAQKIGGFIAALLIGYALFFILGIIWAIGTESLFDGFEF